MEQHIHIDVLPARPNQPRVDFNHDAIDALVINKGSDVIHESAIACPCQTSSGSARPTCKNCGGSGLVFINPLKTKMIVQSMGAKVGRLPDWSSELQGTASITSRADFRFGYMDRITVIGSKSMISEVITMRASEDLLRGFVSYGVSEIIDAFMFDNSDTRLVKLDTVDFSGNLISIPNTYGTDVKYITVRYSYDIQYLIIDNTKDVRNSPIKSGGKELNQVLPVSVIGKRLHTVLNPTNYDGRNLINNSYQ